MKKHILFSLLLVSGASFGAEYNPFLAEKPVEVSAPANNPAVPEATQVVAEDPSSMLDKELQGLLKDLKDRDNIDKSTQPDVTQYVATMNCVDIYYHATEKRYEERKSKSCLERQTKAKIINELNKNKSSRISATGE
ncbi:hypothetical protein ACI2KR_07515 [Pseudomonas luteola]